MRSYVGWVFNPIRLVSLQKEKRHKDRHAQRQNSVRERMVFKETQGDAM